MLRIIKFFIFIIILVGSCPKEAWGAIRYHCPQDSVKVMELIGIATGKGSYGDRIVAVAKALEGTPYAKAADNDSIGTLVVRLDSLNQREFIYITLAAAKTSFQTVPDLKDFEKNLEDISRRKGKDEGFTSQFFYGADWIIDNVYRGNLKEMTEYLEAGNYKTKTLDYVSHHPEEFPAMANPGIADQIKVIEYGYRGHRIPHLKKQSLGNKNIKELIQNGDIIILNPPDTDFDIYDIGIVCMENGEPYLIHIMRDSNIVGTDTYPLSRLPKMEGQFFYGYRWLRPTE